MLEFTNLNMIPLFSSPIAAKRFPPPALHYSQLSVTIPRPLEDGQKPPMSTFHFSLSLSFPPPLDQLDMKPLSHSYATIGP